MNIHLAVDGSEAAQQACRLLEAYQGDRAGHLVTLVNVQRRPLRVSPIPLVDEGVLESALHEQGQRVLEPAAVQLRAAGWAVRTVVRLGPPADTLLNFAKQDAAELLLLGGGRQGLLAGYAIGSVALRVAPAARCPVVLVRESAKLPAQLGLRARVTAPVDGSPASLVAVQRLAAGAAVLGALQVDLVHFRPGLSLIAAMAPPHDDVLAQWSGRESEKVLRAAADVLAAAGIPYEVHALTGEPDAAIAAFARSSGADLVAMATRGRGAMHHLVLGSVALRTAHLSEVPVALMR